MAIENEIKSLKKGKTSHKKGKRKTKKQAASNLSYSRIPDSSNPSLLFSVHGPGNDRYSPCETSHELVEPLETSKPVSNVLSPGGPSEVSLVGSDTLNSTVFREGEKEHL